MQICVCWPRNACSSVACMCVCVCVGTRLESEVGVSSSEEDKAITLSLFFPFWLVV